MHTKMFHGGLDMAELFPILFFIGIFSIIIIVSIYQSKKNKERQESIRRYASLNGLNYKQEVAGFPVEYKFKINDSGHSHLYEALLLGERNGISFVTFDFAYTTGSGKNSQRHIHTVCLLSSADKEFPDFFIREENAFFDYLGKLFGGQDINFTEDKTFSKKFVLQGSSENLIRRFFTSKVRNAFVTGHKKNYVYEAHGDTFAVQGTGFMKPNERVRFLSDCMRIYKEIIPSENDLLG